MSFFEKFFERESGLTEMQKGYSDPEIEITQAALMGDTDAIWAILFSSDEGDGV